jgi:hypothetical protein
MKLAVNYSTQLIELVSHQLVTIDLIKCPDWEGMLEEAKPYGKITIHFDLDVGLGEVFNQDLSRIERLMEKTSTPHVNAHLVTPRNFNTHDKQELHKINDLWRKELGLLVDYFGGDSVTLEHYPYTTANPHIKAAADCQNFSQVIIDTDCRLLLDLAHARISADTMGIDVSKYIQAMPLDRLVEMHTTGTMMYAGVLTDHFELNQKDWEVLDWALAEIRIGSWRKPRLVAFEYGGVGEVFVWRTDINVLRTQIPRLLEMVHQND